MILDCFTFFNENDVLDIRLQELYPVVDVFVVVTGNQTFRGDPKPDYFDYKRFEKCAPKLAFVNIDLVGNTTWEREIYQRNYIKEFLHFNASVNDTIIIGDVDEIPRRSVVRPVDDIYRLLMDKFSYGINMLTDEGNTVVRMLPFGMLTGTVEQMRRGEQGIPVKDAGWEFSSLGDADTILQKLKSFAHDEFDTPDLTAAVLQERMSNKQDIVGRDMWHSTVAIDDTWPEAIKADREYWSKYEWPLV